MSRRITLLCLCALLGALGVRHVVQGGAEEPAEEPWAPARVVAEIVEIDPWVPDPDRRDPFVPLVLPEPSVAPEEALDP